ncbi:MAG: metal-dependent hydrolase [Weeksellaceae bacterium]|jgi:L-ascorbate metabolism protein UlaG (beta-lactamase superfamily)|nr:metal-dependent hydrolase [Weeksellaceae bacterium]
MKITYLGHAGLHIEINGKFIVVDPFISGNPLASVVDLQSLNADYLLLTHAHGDHIADVEPIAERTAATIICNAEMSYYYDAKGFKTIGMNTGGRFNFDGISVKSTIAFHSSSFPDGTYGGNPNGYVLEDGSKRIYIAGDTALTTEMKLIPETIGKPDLAILPVGDHFTMGYQDAYIASNFIQCNRVMGYHFDTFPPIKINHQQAKDHFSAGGKVLILPAIGETLEV